MKKLLMIFVFLLLPFSSQALFEARVGYGTTKLDDDTYQGSQFDDMKGFNLDLIFEPPLISDMGFGVRYEKMKMDIDSNTEADFERISALVNYRFIDLFAYFGVLGTIGLSNDFTTTTGGVTASGYDPKLNYSIGLEGGVSLGLFSIGAEVGKLFAEVKNPGFPDIDLSGMYGKIILGVGF
ncbi:hypothetical protein K2X05_05635 [bacterium]|nr:hypothetical protein [bacterium]